MPVSPKKFLIFSHRKITFVGAEIIVLIPGKVPTPFIHGPGPEGNGITVSYMRMSREYILEVFSHGNGPIHPGIVGLEEGRGIGPQRPGFEIGFISL
jgi:hypothetical protein